MMEIRYGNGKRSMSIVGQVVTNLLNAAVDSVAVSGSILALVITIQIQKYLREAGDAKRNAGRSERWKEKHYGPKHRANFGDSNYK
jgi:hypothetical protein